MEVDMKKEKAGIKKKKKVDISSDVDSPLTKE